MHITPILNSLHWLPVLYRIDVKLLMFVFKALNGLAPSYFSIVFYLNVRNPGRALRSTNQLLLEAPMSKYKHWGDQAFSVAGPRLWNKLPAEMCLISDLGLFISRLIPSSMMTLLSYLIRFCCILLLLHLFYCFQLFFTYSFLYSFSAVKHFGTPKWIVVKGCINKVHLQIKTA